MQQETVMEMASAVKRVLVVDDNADAAFLVAELLKYRGHNVEVAVGGPEGFAAATAMIPDVVLLDLGMPMMDGYQVAKALRDGTSTCAMRLIALTAWGDTESRSRVIQAGFDEHLVKPATFGELYEAVESHGRP
jgi:DNA-binding response OmpR family regulator